MFSRRWSSLPMDVSFPRGLANLGYFVNDKDEVRSIENPECYYKFNISKNDRVNGRQRFHFNMALEDIVHERLEKEGLKKYHLMPENERQSPVFLTPSIAKTTRIVIVLGEDTKDLGWIAGRVANGPGGIAQGTMISVVQAIAKQTASPNDPESPGVILANMGQRFWWPEEKRAITIESAADIPLPSIVHSGYQFIHELNEIPGSETPLAHMTTVFNKVLEVNQNAKVDIISVGSTCEVVLQFFENEKHWAQWGNRLGGMLLMGTVCATDWLANAEFKDFLAQRTRGYLISEEPLNTPLAMPEGNPSLLIEPLGCPCFSSGEREYTETILIKALEPALAYLQETALTHNFINPDMAVAGRRAADITDEKWSEMPEESKPEVTAIDPSVMKEQIRQMRRWKKFAETGLAPESDSDED
ncbi:hypothetical protein FBEOM_8323 [Fusarium beomiforme]|uniref:Arb2 domain-containing protein n=1 Tax=Fusarium beomiforme TaxID=44412 RepID=A0A9P5AG74_9HYPO|nr:hypothetical protein FBEOM_8323 [Fusarium beomiforme]